MFYQQFKPTPELKKYILRYHILEINNVNLNIHGSSWAKQHLMFNYGDPFSVHCPDGYTMSAMDCFFNGSLTRPIVFNAEQININFLLVEFQPLVIRSILREDAHQITDYVTDFFDIFPRENPWINDALKESKTPGKKVKHVDTFLKKVFKNTKIKTPEFITKFIADSNKSRKPMMVYKNLHSSGKSERQLRRAFQNYIGLSPNQFARFSRIDLMQKNIINSDNVSWADLANRHGFFDQAHMIKEFKAMTSFSPNEFAQKRPFTIGHFL